MSICLLVATFTAVMFAIWCLDRRCERIAGWARSGVAQTGTASSSQSTTVAQANRRLPWLEH